MTAEPEVDLSKAYDAVVIGSGAAGGMAAHVLTSKGLKVLLLEAGKKLPIEKIGAELREMMTFLKKKKEAGVPQEVEAGAR